MISGREIIAILDPSGPVSIDRKVSHLALVRFPCILVSLSRRHMLAKLTSKNQLTLPKAIMAGFEGVEYFDVTADMAGWC